MTRAITLIPGDGIGPEVTRAVVRVVEASLASGHVTPDLGGTATTTSFADAICHTLSSP